MFSTAIENNSLLRKKYPKSKWSLKSEKLVSRVSQ